MSFAFAFDGEDYSDSEQEELTQSTQALTIDQSDCNEPSTPPLLPAQHHTLAELLNYLPLTLAYNSVNVNGTKLPRRALWDIKHQLMAGPDNDADGEDESEDVLRLMEHDDVIKGEYEGGFKTWECSLDLVQHLASNATILSNAPRVLELGCGSALPSLQIFQDALQTKRSLKLFVQDYNLQVLKYSTIPNLFLTWAVSREAQDDSHTDLDGEIEVTEELKQDFLAALQSRNIAIECYSGSWSAALSSMVGPVDLILAAETIYETRNLAAFTGTIREALKDTNGTALVAAKSVYFGVGGGVEEFSKEVQSQGMTWSSAYNSQAGVKRTIMKVKME